MTHPRQPWAMAGWGYSAAMLVCLLAGTPSMAVEETPYRVTRTAANFELRRYEPYVAAEVVIDGSIDDAGSQGFRILAGYIFGKNKGARDIPMTAPVAQTPIKIAMTAPVAVAPATGGYAVQFAMPRDATLATLPEPLDARIHLRQVPARNVAVIRYSGFWSESGYASHLAELKGILQQEHIGWHGEPVWARYDPPWIPWFMRRNEIWLETD